MRALVMGATGSVGLHVVQELIQQPSVQQVTLLSRRPLPNYEKESKVAVEVVSNFDEMDKHAAAFRNHTHFFCCHGTTRADAGGAAQFIRIDHDYAVEAARLFRQENTDTKVHCLLVTAVGTDPKSWFLYPQTKGKIEIAFHKMGFQRLTIARPGMLLGRRDSRIGEKIGQALMKPADILFPEKFSIECKQVAKALIGLAMQPEPSAISHELWGVSNPDTLVEAFSNAELAKIAHEFEAK